MEQWSRTRAQRQIDVIVQQQQQQRRRQQQQTTTTDNTALTQTMYTRV